MPTDFPTLNVTVLDHPATGLLFLAPVGYLLIVDNTGFPAFFRRTTTSTRDFKKQGDFLTYFDMGGVEPRRHVAMDSTYTVVDEWVPGNGYGGLDWHDFQLLPNGHALLLIYDIHIVDMSAIVPGGDPNAEVIGLVIQELDVVKNVVFQWRSWDHFQITDATNIDFTRPRVDYVHCNAVELDTDGNLMISSRSLDEITKIDRQTGDVMWRMGGTQNEFTLVGDTQWFSRQHAIRRTSAGTVTIFDNGSYRTPEESRAVEYELDEVNKIATLVWDHRHAPALFAALTGNAQRLPNGNTMISWGGLGVLSETRADGTIALEMNFEEPLGRTYRAFRFPWTGVAAAPTLWADATATSATLHFTKFGDEDVARFHVYGGSSPGAQTWIGSTATSSFLLEGFPSGESLYCRVTAEDAGGNESAFSNDVEVVTPYGPTSSTVQPEVAAEFALYQNHPNPFGRTTTLTFALADEALVHLAVYDVRGRRVKTLTHEVVQRGTSRVIWDGTDARGDPVASGVYLCRLEAAGQSRVRRMSLLR